MLPIKFLYILIKVSIVFVPEAISVNVGSTLFHNKNIKSDYWSQKEIAELRARQIFEKLAPPSPSPENIDARYIKNALKYFKKSLRSTELISDPQIRLISKKALTDMIGGHLRYEILPSARFAYYAGYVSYRNVRSLDSLYDDVKQYLNTQGLGWKEPQKIPPWTNMTVAKILIGPSILHDPCQSLIIRRDTNSCIHLPRPKLDNTEYPSAIALPFKNDGLISLMLPPSENILLKYYTTASKCILKRSPDNCRHTDFLAFNNDLWHWMKRDVAPHLAEEKFFTGFAGILRVAAAVQNYGKGLARRNLFEVENSDSTLRQWHPLKSLTKPFMYLNTDWSPSFYIFIVVLAIFMICVFQACQHYIFKSNHKCRCTGTSRKFTDRHTIFQCDAKDVAYSTVDSTFPAILPTHTHKSIYSSEKSHLRRQESAKSPSVASFRTQKVYDLNENTEQMMAVIVSDNEGLENIEEEASAHKSISRNSELMGRQSRTLTKRSSSPPKIETAISQLRHVRESKEKRQLVKMPKFLTSDSITLSEMTFQGGQVDTGSWPGISSSSSGTSSYTKSRSRRSRSSRDYAWDRRFISRNSTRDYNTVTKSTSQTATSYEVSGTSPKR